MNNNHVLSNLSAKLRSEIMVSSEKAEIPKNTEVMREGQYIKAIPIVTEGLIKVFTRNEDKEFLLYYIRPNESCIMSFDSSLKNTPSKVYASTEENSSVLLMPVQKVFFWMKNYPEMSSLFFEQYNMRYMELIRMINELLFEKMDTRLFNYLKTKITIGNTTSIKTSHQQIANDLGTAREVISRVLKKLENEGKVSQSTEGIKIL